VLKQSNGKILYFNLEARRGNLKKRIISDNLEIIDIPRISVEEIKNLCETKMNLSFVVIDYIQLVKPTSLNVNVLDDVKDIVGILKKLAKDLNIPILVLSQLSSLLRNEEQIDISSYNYKEVSPFLDNKEDKVIFLVRENISLSNEKDQIKVHTIENYIYVSIP